jgi:probable HAF family extracellular repeat protein
LTAIPALAEPNGGIQYGYVSASFTDLGTLGNDSSSTAYDINNSGYIVGTSRSAAGVQRAFAYPIYAMVTIPLGIGVTHSEARGVNNKNEVVGFFHGAPDSTHTRPFFWKSSLAQIERIESNPYAAYYPNVKWSTMAHAINDNGLIVGESHVKWETVDEDFPDTEGDCYTNIPVRWSSFTANASMLFCPVDNGVFATAAAFDVNNSGKVVGMDRGSSDYGLFRINNGASLVTSVPFPKTPTSRNPGSHTGDAYGVNENGAVVGYISYGNVKRALYWNGTSSASADLGVLANGGSSMAREVNDQGFVTGYSEYKTSANSPTMRKAAFIYHGNFGMKKLPAPNNADGEDSLCEAFALNNRNDSNGIVQAVGQCFIDGNWRATRWNIVTKKYTNLPDTQP